jgi:hypothetical protein
MGSVKVQDLNSDGSVSLDRPSIGDRPTIGPGAHSQPWYKLGTRRVRK